jgi:hypothetical protein
VCHTQSDQPWRNAVKSNHRLTDHHMALILIQYHASILDRSLILSVLHEPGVSSVTSGFSIDEMRGRNESRIIESVTQLI